MLNSENLENLYNLAFAMRKKKAWLSVPWDFMVAIKTEDYGTWYGLPIIMDDDTSTGFIIYDQKDGLPVARYMLDEQRAKEYSEYENDSLLYHQHAYYFSFENKSDLKYTKEVNWLKEYCDKHALKCRGRRCYPSFHHCKPGLYAADLADVKEVAFCETFVAALTYMDELLATGEILPEQWQCSPRIREAFAMPALIQQKDGSWKLGEETVPKIGRLNWPRISLNDFDTARMKRFPKNGNIWQMEKFVHEMDDATFSCTNKVGEMIESGIGVYVDGLIVYDKTAGHLMFMDNFFMRIEGQAAATSFLTDIMEKDGRPMKIVVGSEESYEFIKEFCRKLDIQLVLDEVPQLVTVRDNVLAGRNPMENFDDEEWESANPMNAWDNMHGYMADDRGEKKHKNINSNDDKDVIELMRLMANCMNEMAIGNKRRSKKAELDLNRFLDSHFPHVLMKIDNHILEMLLNLAMAFPMDSMLFCYVVGEYQRRVFTREAGFLEIMPFRDDDKIK